MSEIVFIYTLFPSAIEAADCCKTLLEEKLVACANRMAPAISHYMWEGEMQSSEEYPVLLKSSAAKAEAAMERLRALHSYDLPAIACWEATTAPDFAAWVSAETGKQA